MFIIFTCNINNHILWKPEKNKKWKLYNIFNESHKEKLLGVKLELQVVEELGNSFKTIQN